MKAKIAWALLAMSGLFNASFTGGYLRAQSAQRRADEPAERPAAVADRLDLTAQQRQAYVQMREEIRPRIQAVGEALALAREELWAEMAKPHPDAGRVEDLDDRIWQLGTEQRLLAAEYRGKFMDILNAEQREKTVGMIRHRMRQGRGPGANLERFDSDGDGRLSPAERAEAREGMGIAAPPPRMPTELRGQFLERFDFDGDGRISEAERTAARRAWETWQAQTQPARGRR